MNGLFIKMYLGLAKLQGQELLELLLFLELDEGMEWLLEPRQRGLFRESCLERSTDFHQPEATTRRRGPGK